MKEILASVAVLALAAGCTHLEHQERTFTDGQLTWEWSTEGSTFMGVKSVTYFIDKESEAAELSGNGISDNFREVALRAIEKSPELATAIIAAFRPGGQLEGALAELTKTDPALAAAIAEALKGEEPAP
ncbi:unnamed protein product [marine sediment metagenome]|uniref:Uncharacterized protein n=1 Tax=marine sediment metagenome TaxID=412755 RepID=X0ZDC5_9ZZZZ